MNTQNWKIFCKSGSPLNWVPDPYIKLNFNSNTGVGAAGYLVTNTSSFVSTAKLTNGGYLYDDAISASYTYV